MVLTAHEIDNWPH